MNTETKQKQYAVGERVSLTFVELAEQPGIYTLCRRDGTVHGAPWHPHGKHSMALPARLTVWAYITGCKPPTFTLELPAQLGSCYITLPAGDLAACDVHAADPESFSQLG